MYGHGVSITVQPDKIIYAFVSEALTGFVLVGVVTLDYELEQGQFYPQK